MGKIKLNSLEFLGNGVRKLKGFKLDFAERFTIIAGHNGVGKSTILGLVASASGMPDEKTYFEYPFSHDINQIIHFDPDELDSGMLGTPWPKAVYLETDLDEEHWKNLRLTKRPKRLRSVPSTHSQSPNKDISKQDGKVPLPTIYLGVTRILPIGETDESLILSDSATLEEEDRTAFKNFINSVIRNSIDTDSEDFTGLSIEKTRKNTQHPPYIHSSQSASLGQDSLSCIATALASFNKLKRQLGDNYPGGLLIIDEIDAGFHPHAQQKLIEALSTEARKLSLQVIATTHSPCMIQLIHRDSKIRNNAQQDTQNIDRVVYLADTRNPAPANYTLDKILDDMSLTPISPEIGKKQEKVKVYLEDNEAATFFKNILGMKQDHKTINEVKFKLLPLGMGGSNLINLPKFDPYFKSTLLVVDADTGVPRTSKNGLKLPSPKGTRLSPEHIMYTYVNDLVNNGLNKYPTTYHTLKEEGITSDRLGEELLLDNFPQNREASKKWYNTKLALLEQYKLFTFWANDHETEFKSFKTELGDKLKLLVSDNTE